MYQDVGHCCHILKVSRSGYYDWLHRPLSLRKTEDQRIWEKIKYHWEKSRKTYGSPRILEKLKSDGESIGKHRVARIMRENGIQGAARKKFKPQTTDSNHKLPVADRIFETENSDVQAQRPNQYSGGDNTYLSNKEAWLYLEIVIYLFTRKVVGHSMQSSQFSIKSSCRDCSQCS